MPWPPLASPRRPLFARRDGFDGSIVPLMRRDSLRSCVPNSRLAGWGKNSGWPRMPNVTKDACDKDTGPMDDRPGVRRKGSSPCSASPTAAIPHAASSAQRLKCAIAARAFRPQRKGALHNPSSARAMKTVDGLNPVIARTRSRSHQCLYGERDRSCPWNSRIVRSKAKPKRPLLPQLADSLRPAWTRRLADHWEHQIPGRIGRQGL